MDLLDARYDEAFVQIPCIDTDAIDGIDTDGIDAGRSCGEVSRRLELECRAALRRELSRRDRDAPPRGEVRARSRRFGPLARRRDCLYGARVTAIDRLRHDENLRREGVAIVVDALLARRVRDVVDVTGLLALLEVAVVRPPLARGVDEHVLPAFDRFRDETTRRATRVGELLPDDARLELERLLLATRFPRFEWARDAIDPKLLERLFSPVLQELLMQFVGKLPGVGALGALARVGGKAAGGALSGAKSIAAEFSKSAFATLRDAVAARLASDEGRALVEELRRHAFRHVAEVPLAQILADFDALPWREVAKLAPAVVEHDLRSALGHAIVRTELAAFLEVEGTIAELLDEVGVLPDVRAYLRVQGEGVLAALVDEPAFASWLSKLVG